MVSRWIVFRIERGLMSWWKCEQGFRRMAARNEPAGIRSLVYGMDKGKAGIEGLSVFPAGGRLLEPDQEKLWLAYWIVL